MEDYSQSGEQAAIINCLGAEFLPIGSFIDIGAWHPTCFSNTRALFELGWGGLLIEPSPIPVQNLVKEYGYSERVKVIAAAVSVQGGLIEMEVTEDAVSMPADSPRIAAWRKTGGFYGKLTVPSIAMKDLFHQFGGNFQMVSIDTEGSSVDLFSEMLNIGVRPRCVVVEHDDRIVEVNQYAQVNGYRQAMLNGTNVVFEWMSGR